MNTSQSQAFTERLDEILNQTGYRGFVAGQGSQTDNAENLLEQSHIVIERAKDQILALVADEIIGADIPTFKYIDSLINDNRRKAVNKFKATQRKKLGI